MRKKLTKAQVYKVRRLIHNLTALCIRMMHCKPRVCLCTSLIFTHS